MTLPWYILVQQAILSFHYFFVTNKSGFYQQQFNNQFPFWFYLPLFWWHSVLDAVYFSSPHQNLKRRHSNELFIPVVCDCFDIFLIKFPFKNYYLYLACFSCACFIDARYISNFKFVMFACLSSSRSFLLILSACWAIQSTFAKFSGDSKNINPQDEVILYGKYYQDIPFYLNQRVGKWSLIGKLKISDER